MSTRRLMITKIIFITAFIFLNISICLSEEIEGKLTEYKGTYVIVNGKRYDLCHDVKVLNMEGKEVDKKDLKGADTVKLILIEGCISEIRIRDLRH